MAQGLMVPFSIGKNLLYLKTSTKIIMILSLIHGEKS
jgi:hypothetical protein